MHSDSITNAIRTFVLPFAKRFATGWTSLYTAAAPEDEREARRDEVRSDLHEHVTDSQEEGYGPAEIAFQVLARVVLGMKDDVLWSAPYFTATLAQRLESESAALGRVGRFNFLIVAVAVFGMMNAGFIVSEGDKTWGEWLLINTATLGSAVLMWNQHRRWANRIIFALTLMALSVASVWLLWTVLHYRLHETPGFYGILLQVALAALPLVLGAAAKSETCRVRVFKGHRWPTYAAWGVIAAVSVGAALLMGLTTLLKIWMAVAVLTFGFGVLLVIFLSGSAIVCHGALKGGAACMRLMAAGMRRMR